MWFTIGGLVVQSQCTEEPLNHWTKIFRTSMLVEIRIQVPITVKLPDFSAFHYALMVPWKITFLSPLHPFHEKWRLESETFFQDETGEIPREILFNQHEINFWLDTLKTSEKCQPFPLTYKMSSPIKFVLKVRGSEIWIKYKTCKSCGFENSNNFGKGWKIYVFSWVLLLNIQTRGKEQNRLPNYLLRSIFPTSNIRV